MLHFSVSQDGVPARPRTSTPATLVARVLGALEDLDVGDGHLRRAGVVRDAAAAAPGAADGDVEDEVEGLVEGPLLVALVLVGVRVELAVVDEEVEALRRPLDGVDVEVVVAVADARDAAVVVAAPSVVVLRVDGRADDARLVADVLHDVDLAGLGPLAELGGRGHEPDRGPEAALPRREPRADLDAAVAPAAVGRGPRREPRGRVGLAAARLLRRARRVARGARVRPAGQGGRGLRAHRHDGQPRVDFGALLGARVRVRRRRLRPRAHLRAGRRVPVRRRPRARSQLHRVHLWTQSHSRPPEFPILLSLHSLLKNQIAGPPHPWRNSGSYPIYEVLNTLKNPRMSERRA